VTFGVRRQAGQAERDAALDQIIGTRTSFAGAWHFAQAGYFDGSMGSRWRPRVMQWYRGVLTRAPVELSPFLHLGTVPAAAPFPRDIYQCDPTNFFRVNQNISPVARPSAMKQAA
jgi:hypothetical protein